MRSVQIFIDPIAMFVQWEMYRDCHIKTIEKQSGQKLLNASATFKNYEVGTGFEKHVSVSKELQKFIGNARMYFKYYFS